MVSTPRSDILAEAIAAELNQALWPAIDTAVAAIRERHGPAVAAVLFYGSCLRDRTDAGRLLDFYVFTDRYRDFHGWSLAALLNRVLPPNVYYLETSHEGRTVRAKYAVLSLPALRRQTAPSAFLPTLWARFCQPCALPFSRDAATARIVVDALASSVRTMINETAPLLGMPATPRDLWTRAFSATYRTELRPERSNRPAQLYEPYAARYDAVTRAAVAAEAAPGCTISATDELACSTNHLRRKRLRARWAMRRIAGRLVHVARLLKGALTFTDGLDYVLWKIATHSGVTVKPTPWQRRHPVLAAPVLAWRLHRRGAFR